MAAVHLSQRESNILAVCILMIFGYGGFHFIYKPLTKNTETLESRIKVGEKRLHNQLKAVQKEHPVTLEYKKYASHFEQTASDEQEMASILSEIESVANEVNIHIADMKPRKVRRVDFFNDFSVTLTIEGDLPTVIQFLYVLQNQPHLFNDDEVYLEKSSLRSSQMRCRLVLSKILIP